MNIHNQPVVKWRMDKFFYKKGPSTAQEADEYDLKRLSDVLDEMGGMPNLTPPEQRQKPAEPQTFGDALLADMKDRGLTQETFASLMKVSQQAVSNWIANINQPQYKRLQGFVTILGKNSHIARWVEKQNPWRYDQMRGGVGHFVEENKSPMIKHSSDLSAAEALAEAATEIAKAASSLATSADRIAFVAQQLLQKTNH